MQGLFDEQNNYFSRNIDFWIVRKVHLTKKGQPLYTGRGGMMKVVEEMSSTTTTYGDASLQSKYERKQTNAKCMATCIANHLKGIGGLQQTSAYRLLFLQYHWMDGSNGLTLSVC